MANEMYENTIENKCGRMEWFVLQKCAILTVQFDCSQSGYTCMIFYRRDTHIAEVQMGLAAARLEDACTTENLDVAKTPYITLIGE